MPSYALNFRAATNPNWNELQAGTFGASSVFSGNMPYEHYLYSLFAQSNFQQPGTNRITSPSEWERIIRENTPVNPTNTESETVEEKPCGIFDYGCQAGKLFESPKTETFLKSTGLVLLAMILLVIGILSLR